MNNNQFIDTINLLSFFLSILNYQENLTQNDKSEILQNSQNISDAIINKIDTHLQEQDRKIDLILSLLNK